MPSEPTEAVAPVAAAADDAAEQLYRDLAARAQARFARQRRPAVAPPRALAEAAPGCQATIETLEHVPARQREQLLAYGVAPGRVVDVLQTRPVTIIRVEHAELAFEHAVGRLIGIEGGSE